MTRRLSFGDVRAAVERVPDLEGIVVVGGQALNFWAESLGIASADASGPFGPALSDDIDFLGSARAALSFGEALDGSVAVASMEDAHSPNTALVTLDIDGEEHLIDFLWSMAGFSPHELERVKRWAVPLSLIEGGSRRLHILHPAHCLEAQLENIYGQLLNRRHESGGERYVGRIQLAIEACRRIGERYLDENKVRSALNLAEKVHELSLLPSAMRARFGDNVHVEQGIPTEARMPKDFLEKRLPQFRDQLERVAKRFEDNHKS